MQKTLYRTIAEQVAYHIRNDIITGEIPEETLLKEQDLSNRFDVSRGTIRHALMQLVAEGIVNSTPNIGMKVSRHPSDDSMTLIIGIRNNIEDFILRRVFNDLREYHLDQWAKRLKDIKIAAENNDTEAFINADILFHSFFVELYPDKQVTDLWEAARTRMMMRYDRYQKLQYGYAEHKKIFDAVKANNLKAALANLHSNVI